MLAARSQFAVMPLHPAFCPSNSLRAELSAQLGQDPTALNQLQILWGGLSPGEPFVSLSEGMRSKNW